MNRSRAHRPLTNITVTAIVVLAFALALVAGCARVPKESIELSATLGRDLDQVHTAHRNLAELHFARLLDDVDAFVDEIYRPELIAMTADSLGLVAEFDAALQGNSDLAALDVLEIFVDESIAQIDRYRAELRRPIEEQRRLVLEDIARTFQQLQTANAVITGHLASVVKVHDAQAEALGLAGLEDYRERLAGRLARFSDELAALLERAHDIDTRLEDLPDQLREIVDNLP